MGEFCGCVLGIQMYLPAFSSLVTVSLSRWTRSMQTKLQNVKCKWKPSSGTWSDCQPLLYSWTRILNPNWPRIIPRGEWADLAFVTFQPHPPQGRDYRCALPCPALGLAIVL